MRWRTLLAVSALLVQIGSRIESTSAVSISSTSRSPRTGSAFRARDSPAIGVAWRALDHVGARSAITRSAASENFGMPGSSCRTVRCASRKRIYRPDSAGGAWREREGVEPTAPTEGPGPTDLKSAKPTGTHPLPYRLCCAYDSPRRPSDAPSGFGLRLAETGRRALRQYLERPRRWPSLCVPSERLSAQRPPPGRPASRR